VNLKSLKAHKPKIQINEDKCLSITPFFSDINTIKLLKSKLWDENSDIDLETYDGASLAFENISKEIELIVVYGAVETLRDPRPLLKELRNIIISRKKIARVYYLDEDIDQALIFRKYLKEELERLFIASGFNIVTKSEHYFEVKCDEAFYKKFLASRKMPDNTLKHLFVTTEHPDYRITGGIGSYIKEADSHYGKISNILILDDNLNYDSESVEQNGWFSLQNILREDGFDYYQKNDHGATGDAITESLLSLLLYYDLKSIEGADYGGMTLFRQIQAKRTGLLPSAIKLITVCHGSSLYTSNGAGSVVPPHALPLFYRETYSVINADYTVYLTKFMQKLYESHGIFAKNPIYERLPFDFTQVPFRNEDFNECENLIYIGKPTKTKGFDVFLKSILEFTNKNPNNKLKIKCYTTFTDIPEPEVKLLFDNVSLNHEVSLISLKRHALLEELANLSKDSVALVTYPADNHPNVILELTVTGVDFIATDTGGIPELVGTSFQDKFLTTTDPECIAEKLDKVLVDRKNRQQIVYKHREEYLQTQRKINKRYDNKNLPNIKCNRKTLDSHIKETVDVIIPCYNTNIKQVAQALESMAHQSVLPTNTFLINDGSTISGYNSKLKQVTDKFPEINPVILEKKNGGLADARNFGLYKSKSDYVVTLDSDDIVSNFYIEHLLKAIKLNPDSIGITPYLSDFKDSKDNPSLFNPNAYEYHPTGNFLSTSFLPSNFYGSASAIFRRKRLIDVTGGWDSSDKSMWEDWALYIKLKSIGQDIQVLPEKLYFYRVREDSMVRTYSKYEGVNRLIRNFDSMPVLDSYVLYAQQKYIDEIFHGKYPLEIWNPIYEHAKSETLNEVEKLKKTKTEAVYHKTRRIGSRIKSRINKNAKK
jgi:glycosyltransferase involved in cell wall biosynthesis